MFKRLLTLCSYKLSVFYFVAFSSLVAMQNYNCQAKRNAAKSQRKNLILMFSFYQQKPRLKKKNQTTKTTRNFKTH